MLNLTLVRALFACSRALISIPRAYLQFASSNFHSARSICSSHALFSFSRALFAVRVLYFQFRALHLQFVRSNFDSACSICSSHALFSLLRALFSVSRGLFPVRVLYLQFELYFPRAPFAARMLWFPFHVL